MKVSQHWRNEVESFQTLETRAIGDRTGNVGYALGTGNRLASWSAVSTNGFAGMARVASVSGSTSETIGTDPRWGERSVSNSATQAVVSPLIDGTNYSGTVELQPGTQTVVAAISDVAGNVGFATNSATMNVVTNAQYLSDAAGCLTNVAYSGTDGFSNTVSLEWDERYRLKRFVVPPSGGSVEYEYDVLDRRVSRMEIPPEGGTTNITHFVYNDRQVVADLDDSGNLLRSYAWGPGIDNLLCFTDHATSNTYYAVKDHQNSVLAFVDSSGAIVETYEYDAWGRTRVFDAGGAEIITSNIGNRYLFQGREIDWATGFYYFRARWYDPVSGRWLSKDPIGISGGLNLYEAFGSNPVNFVDPSGLDNINLGYPGNRSTAVVDARGTKTSEYQVGGHGFSDGSGPVDQRSGRNDPISVADLANEIKSDPNYDPSNPVRLNACKTGAGSYAQDLANELGNTVIAPEGNLYSFPWPPDPWDPTSVWDFARWKTFCPE